jgi:anti-anti-sigma factor
MTPAPVSGFDVHVVPTMRQVIVRGEVDVATAPLLAAAVATVRSVAPGDITMLFEEVTFIDATGLGAIVDARNTQNRAGGRLDVVGLKHRDRRVFDLCEVDAVQPHLHERSDASTSSRRPR